KKKKKNKKKNPANGGFFYALIYHNPLIVRTAQAVSGRFRRETGKTGNKQPETPPESAGSVFTACMSMRASA
ncbi:hypothetical protein, partial [Klebsiella pneumoniae]|uniref:hypothetical protein n=1 Tax=Klebsiella pneumoniae TaxID=573 RepID=UPI001C610559